MEMRFRRRHREKPKLITLCDVSDSVRNASRFMLQLVWSLQECFSRVRSYVFVSEIAEVTQAFNTYPVDTAIDWALKSSSVDYHCRSDFGYAFNRFVQHRARVARPQDHRADPGRRPQQLQRPAGVGHPADPRAGEGHHLAQSRRPVGLGHRRQRDAALRAGLRHRARSAARWASSSRSSTSSCTPGGVAGADRAPAPGLRCSAPLRAPRPPGSASPSRISPGRGRRASPGMEAAQGDGRGRSTRSGRRRPALSPRGVARRIGIQAGAGDGLGPRDLSRSWPGRGGPIEFPTGSDERKSTTNDSALAVYAVFPHSAVLGQEP